MKELKFLHISDLHLGEKWSVPYIGNMKEELLKDLQYVCKEKLEGIDIILMTGDMTQTGSEEEFNSFESFLNDIVSAVTIKEKPKVFFVPGNHDLERCSNEGDPTHLMLLKWADDEDLRNKYFWKENSVYLKYVEERFKNYTTFVESYNKRQNVTIKSGSVPGDYYACEEINGIKIGIVGLNSSFLQVASGDFKNKLGIYIQQLTGVLGNEYTKELKKNDFSLLLTHHSEEWFEPNSKDQYNSEILSGNKFLEHYCGHNHVPKTQITSVNYDKPKIVNVGHSLFGVDFKDKIERIQGYQAGKFIISDEGKISKENFPRMAFKRESGYEFDKDISFSFNKGQESIVEPLKDNISKGQAVNPIDSIGGDILDNKPTKSEIQPNLLKSAEAHTEVRLDEQNNAYRALNANRLLWIETRYGLCSERFLSSVFCKINDYQLFNINVEGRITNAEIESQIKDQFGKSINSFVDELTKNYSAPVLIFRFIEPEIVKNELETLKKTAQSILNFNKNAKIIFVSTVPSGDSFFNDVQLQPFTIDEVKHYLQKNGLGDMDILDVEKIYDMTSGYPLCIDLVIKRLQYMEVSDLDASEFSIDSSIKIPKTLQEYIKELKESENKIDNRKYNLLRLLALMPKGEMFASIRRFYPTQPVYPQDITDLIDKDLLFSDSYHIVKDDKDIEPVKVLRMPSLYRELILSWEDDNVIDLYMQISLFYLGDSWKQGTIKLDNLGKNAYYAFKYGNVQAAICALLQKELNNDEKAFRKYVNVAINFVAELHKRGYFYVGLLAISQFVHIVEQANFSNHEFLILKSSLKLKMAGLKRMNGYRDEAKTLYQEVLKEKILNNIDLQDARESLAYLSDSDTKVLIAQDIANNEKNNESQLSYVAKYIIAVANKDERIRRNSLKTLYTKVKNKGYKGPLKSNIAIQLSYCNSEDINSAIKRINQCIKTENDSYTKMRLFARKYTMLTSQAEGELSDQDITAVKCTYSYAFTQMLPQIMNEPHRILWQYYSSNDSFPKMAQLLRYSIFVWEMKESLDLKRKYISEAKSNTRFVQWLRSQREYEELLLTIEASHFDNTPANNETAC